MSTKMTLARANTRVKTIKAQLASIAEDMSKYAAWNSKEKCLYADTKVSIGENHEMTEKALAARHQQFQDLTMELSKIVVAVQTANLVTKMAVNGEVCTIAEGLIRQHHIESFLYQMAQGFSSAMRNAEYKVANHNSQFAKLDDTSKASVIAEVKYFIPFKTIKAYTEEVTLWKTEFNSCLNEVNATTEIEIAD